MLQNSLLSNATGTTLRVSGFPRISNNLPGLYPQSYYDDTAKDSPPNCPSFTPL
jgi:hypothetical protein